jgi:hypothetical protein
LYGLERQHAKRAVELKAKRIFICPLKKLNKEMLETNVMLTGQPLSEMEYPAVPSQKATNASRKL